MIKIMRYGTLVLIILVLISCKTHARELIYRPITLTVLDAETKQPLEGIGVILVNYIFYSKPVMFSFSNMGTIGRFVRHVYNYETNENGIIEIPQFKYEVDSYHFIDSQKIIINLDIKENFIGIDNWIRYYDFTGAYSGIETSFYFRLRPEYKAGELLFYTQTSGDFEQFENTKPYITLLYNKYEISEEERISKPTSFNVGHEEFIFYLERFIEP